MDQSRASLYHLQRLAGVGTLASSVAHELTNPLSVITATCNNLLGQLADETLGGDELLHYVELIDQSAWRCARIVQTLRNYAHNDTSPSEADLNKIIEDTLVLVAYQFRRDCKIEIETDLAVGLPRLMCDQNQISQVLINLLINARDALHPRGGVIEISSWVVPEEAAVAFSLSDSGFGIAPEIASRIFEPFFTTKAPEEGTGLGLSVAADIVEQHHGRIEVSNRPSGGATFTVILPCRRPG